MDKSTEDSFIASLGIAKQKKPHNIGKNSIKPFLINVALLLCRDNNGEKIKTVSNDTVKQQIAGMADDGAEDIIATLKMTKFAVQQNESTTIATKAILILCVRDVMNRKVNEDFLLSENLKNATKGETSFRKSINVSKTGALISKTSFLLF